MALLPELAALQSALYCRALLAKSAYRLGFARLRSREACDEAGTRSTSRSRGSQRRRLRRPCMRPLSRPRACRACLAAGQLQDALLAFLLKQLVNSSHVLEVAPERLGMSSGTLAGWAISKNTRVSY